MKESQGCSNPTFQHCWMEVGPGHHQGFWRRAFLVQIVFQAIIGIGETTRVTHGTIQFHPPVIPWSHHPQIYIQYTRLFLLPTRRNLKFGKTLLHAAKQQIQQVASSDLERLAENGENWDEHQIYHIQSGGLFSLFHFRPPNDLQWTIRSSMMRLRRSSRCWKGHKPRPLRSFARHRPIQYPSAYHQ